MTRSCRSLAALALILAATSCAATAPPDGGPPGVERALTGDELAVRSTGAPGGGGEWMMRASGYVGTYVRLAQPGTLRLTLDLVTPAPLAHVNAVVGDRVVGYDVRPGALRTWRPTFDLPAGTYFVRIELTNDAAPLDVRLLTVAGAEVLNEASDANALAAKTSR